MQLKAMLNDEDAVSPVIGVILMVAITVILAAVIASFVLGLGPGEATPTASFDFEGDTDQIQVTHAQGDKIDQSSLSVQVNDGSTSATLDYTDVSEPAGDGVSTSSSDTEIGSGHTVTIDTSTAIGGSGAFSGLSDVDEYDVSIVYDGGDQTATLDSGTVNVS